MPCMSYMSVPRHNVYDTEVENWYTNRAEALSPRRERAGVRTLDLSNNFLCSAQTRRSSSIRGMNVLLVALDEILVLIVT